MYGSGRCNVINFIFTLSFVTFNYAEISFILYVLMLNNKYDTNMNVQGFIKPSVTPPRILCALMKKINLQNLYVSLVRLKSYNSDHVF
jgi:hypothetical protein